MDTDLLILCISSFAIVSAIAVTISSLTGNNKNENEENLEKKTLEKRLRQKPRHPKYKIKEGDTNQSITDLFGIAEDIWRNYHNCKCQLDDGIGEKLPEHLKEIYLHPDLWDKEIDIYNKRIEKEQESIRSKPLKRPRFGWRNTLYLKQIALSRDYGVSITIGQGTNAKTIKYEIKIRYFTEDEDVFVEVWRKPAVYINNKKSDLIADEIAVETFNCLQPMVFSLSRDGEIVDVRNLNEIKERWNKACAHIQHKWQGEWMEKYIRLINAALHNNESFIGKMRQDWFLWTYFLGIHQTYTEKYEIEKELAAPAGRKDEPVKCHVKQKVSSYLDYHERIQVKLSGELYDNKIDTDLENTSAGDFSTHSPKPSGSLSGKYFVCHKTHIIDAAIMEVALHREQTKIITVKIHNIN